MEETIKKNGNISISISKKDEDVLKILVEAKKKYYDMNNSELIKMFIREGASKVLEQ